MRILLYSIIRLFGYEFWLLPNINEDVNEIIYLLNSLMVY